MTEWLGYDALLALADWVLKATLLLAVARLITSAPGASAASRHLTWVAAFGAVLLLPALSLFVPARSIVVLSHVPAGASVAVPTSGPEEGSAPQAPAGGHGADDVPFTWPERAPVLIGVLCLWLAGVVAVSLRAALGMLALAALRRRSVEWMGRSVDPAALAGRVGLARAWELRSSDASGPRGAMTWGLVRPVVLLPARATAWPAGRLEAVLLHELAHVRRRDSASQLLALAACALLWFNPIVWLCARAMRADAELAADDAVLVSGFRASDYAAHLMHIAAETRPHRRPVVSAAVMATGRSKIEARIEAIVDPARRRDGVRRRDGIAAAVAGLLAVLMLASARPAIARASESGQPTTSTAPALGQNGDGPPADVIQGPAPGADEARGPRLAAGADVYAGGAPRKASRRNASRSGRGAESPARSRRSSPDLAEWDPGSVAPPATGPSSDLAPAGRPVVTDGRRGPQDTAGPDTYSAPRRTREDTSATTTGADVRRYSTSAP